MTRCALLISEGIICEDVELARAFLETPEGGAWQANEILVCQSVARDGLFAALKIAARCDFAFVYVRAKNFGGGALSLNARGETVSPEALEAAALRAVSVHDFGADGVARAHRVYMEESVRIDDGALWGTREEFASCLKALAPRRATLSDDGMGGYTARLISAMRAIDDGGNPFAWERAAKLARAEALVEGAREARA